MILKKCPYCKRLNDSENNFCIFCGKKFPAVVETIKIDSPKKDVDRRYSSDEDNEGVSYEETMDMFY